MATKPNPPDITLGGHIVLIKRDTTPKLLQRNITPRIITVHEQGPPGRSGRDGLKGSEGVQGPEGPRGLPGLIGKIKPNKLVFEIVDDFQDTFILSSIPENDVVLISINGLFQNDSEYTLLGNILTLTEPVENGDSVMFIWFN